MIFPEPLFRRASNVIERCVAGGNSITTAESCTGGLLAALLTGVPGASAVFPCGFVTYSNDAKAKMLGVSAQTLQVHGAVSMAVAREMAEGALASAGATHAIGITGIAGPGGRSMEKPVGLVFIALAQRGVEPRVEKMLFDGGRDAVRMQAVEQAIAMLEEAI